MNAASQGLPDWPEDAIGERLSGTSAFGSQRCVSCFCGR